MRKFLVLLLVLVLAGIAGDRVAHRLATDHAQSRLEREGLTGATVEIRGFPFLTQAARRSFSEVRVEGATLRTEDGTARRIRATGYDVTAPSSGPVSAERLTASGTVSYQEVLRQTGADDVRLSDAGDGQVRVEQDVVILGRSLTASAVGRIEARGQRLRLVPTSVELADPSLPDVALAESLVDQLSFDYRLPELAEGVVLRRVVPRKNGFRVFISGRDVTLPSRVLSP